MRGAEILHMNRPHLVVEDATALFHLLESPEGFLNFDTHTDWKQAGRGPSFSPVTAAPRECGTSQTGSPLSVTPPRQGPAPTGPRQQGSGGQLGT